MKKLVNIGFATAILAIAFMSCNDNNDDFPEINEVNRVAIDSIEIMKDSVEVDSMEVNAIQKIITYSDYAQGCEGFYGYDYQIEDFDRLVTAYKYKTNSSCGQPKALPWNFDFRPNQTGTYNFKFWKGKDSLDADVWIEKTIVVVDSL
ncbi:MAG: hypothetical protein LBE36_03360 [Flavobacteriaceae bacterium]|jgi:hypothetical protein|nr:hypothetical protein [Flavobacteriaceae bacterium]